SKRGKKKRRREGECGDVNSGCKPSKKPHTRRLSKELAVKNAYGYRLGFKGSMNKEEENSDDERLSTEQDVEHKSETRYVDAMNSMNKLSIGGSGRKRKKRWTPQEQGIIKSQRVIIGGLAPLSA
ncbi:hypothetical protein BX616_008910, partial [Lobosporangium transversale]